MPVKLNSSGGGSVTIDVPSTASAYTLTAPAYTANIITNKTPGTVLQVVSSTFTSTFSSSSGSFVSVGLTASITPTSTSSKVLVMLDSFVRTDSANFIDATIYRNSTNLGGTYGLKNAYVNGAFAMPISFTYYDSPTTTSSTSYTFYMRTENATTFYLEAVGRTSTIVLMEIAA